MQMRQEEKGAHAWVGWRLAIHLHSILLLQEIPGSSGFSCV